MKGKIVDGQFIGFTEKYLDYDGKRYIYPLNNPNAPFLELGWKEVVDKDEEVEYNPVTQYLKYVYEETETEIIRSYVAEDIPTPEPVTPVEPSEEEIEQLYKERVEMLIRQRYSVSDELAILRQKDTKPNEFAVYNAFCESCKAQAKEEKTNL